MYNIAVKAQIVFANTFFFFSDLIIQQQQLKHNLYHFFFSCHRLLRDVFLASWYSNKQTDFHEKLRETNQLLSKA